MPLPLGHIAIGLATHASIQHTGLPRSRPGTFALVAILANLPDVDILLGLLVQGNGNLFHRGPTHSLLFAILTGYIAANLWRLWARLPRLAFALCFSLVFSHVLADMLLTRSPVSMLWPFQLHWSPGVSGWGTVVQTVLFQSIHDGGIILCGVLYLCLLRIVRETFKAQRVTAEIPRRQR